MTFSIIIFFMVISVITLIIGITKKNKKVIIISLISLSVFLIFGIAVFMALGKM